MTNDDPSLENRRHSVLDALFGVRKPIIGTVHLPPLPGAPRYEGASIDDIAATAIADAQAYVAGGVDGLIVENEGDIPFLRPEEIGAETVAALTAATLAVRRSVHVPVGVMCLASAAPQSIAIAKASGAAFIRANQWANAYIANEGFIQGAAAETLRLRAALHARDVRVLADVHVKHGSHSIVADRPVAEQARDVEAFDADVLIATGQRTGDATTVEEVLAIRDAVTAPVIVGSGLSAEIVPELLSIADGAIVGSAMKVDGVWWNPVDVERVRRIMKEVEALR